MGDCLGVSSQWLDQSYAEAPVDTWLCKDRYDDDVEREQRSGSVPPRHRTRSGYKFSSSTPLLSQTLTGNSLSSRTCHNLHLHTIFLLSSAPPSRILLKLSYEKCWDDGSWSWLKLVFQVTPVPVLPEVELLLEVEVPLEDMNCDVDIIINLYS